MNKALLLDRDGVINREINYLHRIENFEFLDGIFESCKIFFNNGYLIIIITNQAGIGRGYYAEKDFLKVNEWMVNEFKKHQVEIRKTYYCPYHPTEGLGHYKRDSFDRKPNPGMIFKARDEFNLNLQACILVGDKESDIEAGINAGVGTNVLVTHNQEISSVSKADVIVDSVKELPKVLNKK
ncbi:MAG: D-glycero-alpha-D-manno-heptose-1,7-bisphosphate 7-phosphatase [bacterium]